MFDRTLFGLTVLLSLAVAGNAQAVVLFDQNVTNDVIFGSGNTNGGFTVDRANGIELGLRAKLRFDDTNQPQNVFNSNGNGSYSFAAGAPQGGGFSFAPGSPSTATWNFEWSINSNFDGSGGNLDQFLYTIQIDFDPADPGSNFQSFDPINGAVAPAFPDHAIGDNSTGNGGGTEASDAADYADLIANNNLAQNSWNMEFFDEALNFPFDANVPGVYSFVLSAFNLNQELLSSVSIDVVVTAVPEPTTAILLLSGLLSLLAVTRRRRATAASFPRTGRSVES